MFRKSVILDGLKIRKSVYLQGLIFRKSVIMLYWKIGKYIENHLKNLWHDTVQSGKQEKADGGKGHRGQGGKPHEQLCRWVRLFDCFRYFKIEEYKVHEAFVLSNAREVEVKNGITYMPIYYVSFFRKTDDGQVLLWGETWWRKMRFLNVSGFYLIPNTYICVQQPEYGFPEAVIQPSTRGCSTASIVQPRLDGPRS